MLKIGELAAAAGTTPRAVRHYHAVGLLPEPERRPNGYRAYDAAAVLRLLRIRRLRALGLTLPEVRDALGDPSEQELRDVLAELVQDLERQEAEVREQRQRLLALLDRDRDLDLPGPLAELLSEVRRLVPDDDLVAREAELLELLSGALEPDRFDRLAGAYRQALADPGQVERSVALGQRFEALAPLDPADPEVAAVAAGMVALGRDSAFADAADPEATAGQAGQQAVWSAYRASLAPAQQRCMELAERGFAP